MNQQPTQPSPTESTIAVSQTQLADGTMRARLDIYHAAGVDVHFLAPDVAKVIGESLARIGQAGNLAIAPPHRGNGLGPLT